MKHARDECPAEKTLRVIGGKWKVPILYYLWDERRRFNELRTCLGGVAPKVLTEHLRAMERDGLLSRRTFAEVPPRVEYKLTAKGRGLKPVVEAMVKWGKTHRR